MGFLYALFRTVYEGTTEWIESYWYVLTHYFEPEEPIESAINSMIDAQQTYMDQQWSNIDQYGDVDIPHFIPRPTEDDSAMYKHYYHIHHNPCAEIRIGEGGECPICERLRFKEEEFLSEKEMEL